MSTAIQDLSVLDPHGPLLFRIPQKKIDDSETLRFWLESQACSDVVMFLMQLNYAMFPPPGSISTMPQEVSNSPVIQGLSGMISKLEDAVSEAPPDPGPRRFGNKSFRKWYEIVEERVNELLKECLPETVWDFGKDGRKEVQSKDEDSPMVELRSYLMGSFGSEQRLDFGTGHELSFLAFLGGLWKLGAFEKGQEKDIVLGIIEPYLNLIRILIKTYNLEPAGSHGVWGLDDHFFLPYIFGSAQLSPARSLSGSVPLEGSAFDAPKTGAVTDKKVVNEWRHKNMYFAAIGFIYDVKKGPFWEHSPMLYDISGVPAGWAKINKGMIKMYHAEVLSKFPVVQHFPFGGLYKWEKDPSAASTRTTAHISNTSKRHPTRTTSDSLKATSGLLSTSIGGTKAPWPTVPASIKETTRAPWANVAVKDVGSGTRPSQDMTPPSFEDTKAPWVAQSLTSLPSLADLSSKSPRRKQDTPGNS